MKIYIFILLLITAIFSAFGTYKEAGRARAHGKRMSIDGWVFVVFTVLYLSGCILIWLVDGERL